MKNIIKNNYNYIFKIPFKTKYYYYYYYYFLWELGKERMEEVEDIEAVYTQR